MGYKAAEAAVTALDGGELEEFIDSGSGVVDADSAQERLVLTSLSRCQGCFYFMSV